MKRLLYIEIAEKIMIQVLKSEIEANTKVPSVREMALIHNVNPKTIQRAFDYLDDLGLFYSVVGEGRFLSNDEATINNIKKNLITSEIESFVFKMKEYGCHQEELITKIKEQYEK